MARPFRDRNPVVIGAISLAVIAGLVLLAFNAQNLPLIGGGTVYRAQFSEAAGLEPDDPVRIAGVKVGQVESLALEDGAVTVEFRVKDAFVGNRMSASGLLLGAGGADGLNVTTVNRVAETCP